MRQSVHSTYTPPSAPRTRWVGEYQLIRRIADGGFGEVHQALAPSRGIVALKLPLENNERAIEDFEREATVLRELDHPNIVPLLAAEWIDGLPVLVFPLADTSLDTLVEDGVGTDAALDYAEQLLSGLAYMHRRGFLHCDLKPGNLLLLPDDTLVLADFGLARPIGDEHAHTTSGTAEYMAPEHRDGVVSTRSDVYEAAVVIVELLSGWLVENPEEVSVREVLPRSSRCRALACVLQRALDPNPNARYPDGAAFARAFRHALRRRLH